MLPPSEFDACCDHLELSHQAQELIQRIRTSEPSRNVGGGSKNVFGRYPSRKMGVTIQFESHKIELPTIYQFETLVQQGKITSLESSQLPTIAWVK